MENTSSDLGGFMYTWSGKKFYPLHPEVLEIDVRDIAHALARNNRYGGHLDCPLYSVAQHSVHVMELAFEKYRREIGKLYGLGAAMFQLQALLHDASEAYMMDMPYPIKKILPDFQKLEARLEQHIMDYFNLPYPVHPIIKEVDKKIRVAEAHSLSFGWEIDTFLENIGPNSEEYLNYKIVPLDAFTAEKMFLDNFYALTKDS